MCCMHKLLRKYTETICSRLFLSSIDFVSVTRESEVELNALARQTGFSRGNRELFSYMSLCLSVCLTFFSCFCLILFCAISLFHSMFLHHQLSHESVNVSSGSVRLTRDIFL